MHKTYHIHGHNSNHNIMLLFLILTDNIWRIWAIIYLICIPSYYHSAEQINTAWNFDFCLSDSSLVSSFFFPLVFHLILISWCFVNASILSLFTLGEIHCYGFSPHIYFQSTSNNVSWISSSSSLYTLILLPRMSFFPFSDLQTLSQLTHELCWVNVLLLYFLSMFLW